MDWITTSYNNQSSPSTFYTVGDEEGASGVAMTVAIDSFNVSTIDLNAVGGGSASGFSDDVGILGGEHEVVINHVSGADVRLRIDYLDSNVLAYSQDASSGKGNATVRWDGNEDNATVNDLGLGGQDLTGGTTNDSFRLRIVSNDLAVGLTIKFFETLDNYDSFSFNTPGSILAGDFVAFVIPFSSFTATGSGGDETSAEAVQLEIDGTVNAEADISIDLFEASKKRDFGDLPITGTPNYSGIVKLSSDGARHIPQGLRLGNKVDAEADGQPSTNAVGDDNNDVSDEDGVSRDTGDKWTNGATRDLTVEVNGCSGTCYLNGWIDWGVDNSFTGDQVFTNEPVINRLVAELGWRSVMHG